MRSRDRIVRAICASGCSALALASAYAESPQLDAQIDAALPHIDTDGNGAIGFSEAKRFGITADVFRKANPERDGSLTRAQFATAIVLQFSESKPEPPGRLDWKKASRAGVRSKQIFDAADADHDGRLAIREYFAALVAQSK